jgi:serine/threonine protein kinase
VERGTLIADKYELVERLGRGGMGEVWAGRDRDLHRNVAVKFLVVDDTPADLLHRFDREAVAAAQINHSNVVALYERGVHDGLRFMVMERVEGTNLASRMHGRPPMELAQAIGIAQEICAALVAAHQAKVVHYDIKPSNVMLTSDGRVKVVDFGIAGFSHTHTFTIAPTTMLSPAGTASYGAPEQFLDQRGDERSDLYALGSVLFALLAGEPPFTGANDLSVIRRKIDGEPPRLNALRPGVPPALTHLVSELLQRDPDQRPQSAEAVHDRLEQARFAATVTGDRKQTVYDTVSMPETPPRARDNFGISWTGREPSSTRTEESKKNLRRHWLAFGVLAVVMPLLFVVGMSNGDDSASNQPEHTFFILGIVAFFGCVPVLAYGVYLAFRTLR